MTPEERQQWWERKAGESSASQSRVALLEEWKEVEKEWEVAEEIRKREEEEERERREALEKEEEKNGWRWRTGEVDLGDDYGESPDSGPYNHEPDNYDYEPDMDNGEYNPYEDDYDSD